MTAYLEPTQEAGRAFVMRGIEGEVVMLNLLRFREVAIIPPRLNSRPRHRSAAPRPMTSISPTLCRS